MLKVGMSLLICSATCQCIYYSLAAEAWRYCFTSNSWHVAVNFLRHANFCCRTELLTILDWHAAVKPTLALLYSNSGLNTATSNVKRTVTSMGVYSVALHDIGMHDVGLWTVGVRSMALSLGYAWHIHICLARVSIKHYIYSAVENW